MDIDELQTVQSRERQTDSLQQLRDSFYAEASEFIQQLREARDDAAERADDPWDNPEVNRLSDEIKTAEQTVEAIYDRRVGKIVKKASLAAAEMPTDEDGLTSEEQALFERLVESIQDNRDHVLDMVAGDVEPGTSPVSSDHDPVASQPEPAQPSGADTAPPSDATDPAAPDQLSSTEPEQAPPPEPGQQTPPSEPDPAAGTAQEEDSDTVSAADVMDSGAKQADGGTTTVPPDSTADPSQSDESTTAPVDEMADGEAVARQTVRITKDVGEILGVDQRSYDLSTDDVVTLPEDNAEPLLQQDAAKPLD